MYLYFVSREGDRQIFADGGNVGGGTIPKQHLPNGGPGRSIPTPPTEGKTCDLRMNGGVPPNEGGGVAVSSANISPATLAPPGPRQPRRPSDIAITQDSQLGQGASTSSFPNRRTPQDSQNLHESIQPPGSSGPARGPPRRKLTRDEMLALRRQEGKESKEPVAAQRSTEKDCFIIPQGNLERFLPDGITVRILLILLQQ